MAEISVVIPARDAGGYLIEAVRSALDQTVPPREVLVIDDGSTDGSMAPLAGLEGVRVLEGPGQGPAEARNIGIGNAAGELIGFLDADDLWLPRKLEFQMTRFQDPGVGVAFTDFLRGEDPKSPGPPRLRDYERVCEGDVLRPLLHENFILTSSILARRDLLRGCGGFDSRFFGTEDIQLWLRLARDTRFAWVREPLAFKRDHPDNLTRAYDFPFAQVKRWTALNEELAPEIPDEANFIGEQLARARYAAGRHALRHGDLPAARRELAGAASHPATRGASRPWRLMAALPDPLVRTLLAFKQGRGASDRGPA